MALNSGVPLTMYGWDILWSMRTGAQKVAELCASANPVIQVAGRLLAFEAADPSDGAPVIYDCIGDAGTLCALVAPELFGVESRPVQIVLAPGPARGQTIVDRRAMAGEDSAHHLDEPVPTIDVVSSARSDEAFALFIGCLENDLSPTAAEVCDDPLHVELPHREGSKHVRAHGEVGWR